MINKLKDFYKNRKVYITGITGFTGTWLAIMLTELGADVSGIGMLEHELALSEKIQLHKKVNVAYSDITSPATSSNFIETISYVQPDVIFHLASQSVVNNSIKQPFTTFNTNVLGTLIVHEVLRGLDKKVSLVNVTADKILKNKNNSSDPCSLSQEISHSITSCYSEFIDSQIVSSTVKTCNLIGGGDFSKNRIVPELIQASKNDTELLVTHPESVRAYLHVLDAVLVYCIVGMLQYENPQLSDNYDLWPKDKKTLTTLDLINKFKEYFDFKYKTENNKKDIYSDIKLDPSQLIKITEWEPIYKNIDEVVKATSIWYNSFMNKKDPYKLMIDEISTILNSEEENR